MTFLFADPFDSTLKKRTGTASGAHVRPHVFPVSSSWDHLPRSACPRSLGGQVHGSCRFCLDICIFWMCEDCSVTLVLLSLMLPFSLFLLLLLLLLESSLELQQINFVLFHLGKGHVDRGHLLDLNK